VLPGEIERQRELGWSEFHPEDYCHRCGGRNIVWFVKNPIWNAAAEQHLILCPSCLVIAHEEATGEKHVWELRIDTPPPSELRDLIQSVFDDSPHASTAYWSSRIAKLVEERTP
jgi:hypothetical protein